MEKRPLEKGETVRARIVYDERGSEARFFNPERFAKVYECEVFKRIATNLGECRDCPHSKIDIKHEVDHAMKEKFVEGKAFCKVTCGSMGMCPVKEPDSGYLSLKDEKMDDWLAEAERYAADNPPPPFRFASLPRRGGKSFAADIAKKISEEGRITGKSATHVFVDEVDDIKVSMVGWDEFSSALHDEELDEAVEFETNRQNYDNFGSW